MLCVTSNHTVSGVRGVATLTSKVIRRGGYQLRFTDQLVRDADQLQPFVDLIGNEPPKAYLRPAL
jgi:hypothetical protein